MTDNEIEPFGFTVERAGAYDFDRKEWAVIPGQWLVRLPHHCCPLDLAHPDGDAAHADAVAALERFVAEAQQALAALKDEREFGTEEVARVGS
jgi:hypothetical protein